MKNLSFLNVFFLALAIFFFFFCGNDDDDDFELSPDASFVADTDVISEDADLAPGESFTVRLNVVKGDNDLTSLTIYEDGLTLDASRITFAHTATANNPQIIADTDKQGLTWDITIVAQSDASVVNYDFEITDGANNTGSTSLNINTAVFEATITDGSGCFSVDAIVDAATNFCLNINGTRGADALSTLTIYENNDEIDVSRLDITENPLTLTADQESAFSDLVVSIDSHTDGTSEYRAVLTDAGGATTEASIFVTVGTVVDELTGVLLNAGGPPGTGGLDLDTGNGNIGSMDPAAEIRDEGIDISLPVDANWIQKISGVNGSEIRYANNLPEGFRYDNIAVSEEIAGAFDNSDVLSGNVTEFVVVGDEFVVKNGDNYYFILVTEVNETDADNDDNYVLSIKK